MDSEKKNIYFTRFDGVAKVLIPKHSPMLNIPPTSPFEFELLSLVFSLIAMGFQLINIYKTVWWPENSYQTYAMNFYLINTQVLIFSLVILTRRLFYNMLKSVSQKLLSRHFYLIVVRILRTLLFVSMMAGLVYLSYQIFSSTNYYNIVTLFYPIICYFLTFGFKLEPFFDIQTPFISSKPYHSCSMVPSIIREEICLLRKDFNKKLKQAIFHALITGYYATILPCLFAPTHLYYDTTWVALFSILVTYVIFATSFVQVYPISYLYVLHQATMHLGKWTKIECRSSLHIPSHVWNENTLWPLGALVKFNKEYYRGEGICNAAEPGSVTHKKFWYMFKSCNFVLNTLLIVQLGMFGLQMACLVKYREWHRLLCVMLIILDNYYLIYYLAKVYFAFGKTKKPNHLVNYESCVDSKLKLLTNYSGGSHPPCKRKYLFATNMFIFIVVGILTVYSLSLCILMFANSISVFLG